MRWEPLVTKRFEVGGLYEPDLIDDLDRVAVFSEDSNSRLELGEFDTFLVVAGPIFLERWGNNGFMVLTRLGLWYIHPSWVDRSKRVL